MKKGIYCSFLLTFVFVLFSACDVIPIIDPPATVNRVLDGNTVDVTLRSGERFEGRLAGTNIPDPASDADQLQVNTSTLQSNRHEAAGWLLDQLPGGDTVRVDFLPENGRPARSADDKPLILLYDQVEKPSEDEQGEEQLLNHVLIEKGYARFKDHPRLSSSVRETLRKAEQTAKENNRGIWGE